jgi:hypothetical protein
LADLGVKSLDLARRRSLGVLPDRGVERQAPRCPSRCLHP